MGRSAKCRVTKAILRHGSSIYKNLPMRWWDIELDCGHLVERRVRFPPGVTYRRGFAAQWHPRPDSEALPAPKWCYCPSCKEDANGVGD